MNEDCIVCIIHGSRSSPSSPKIQQLKQIAESIGFTPIVPDFSTQNDPDIRVAEIAKRFSNEQNSSFIFVGSSNGGYVATMASKIFKTKGLFLLAPAFYMLGYLDQDPRSDTSNIEIIHGRQDEVVPVDNSIRFAQKSKAQLHLFNDDHSLMKSMPEISKLFSDFLNRMIVERDSRTN